MANLGTPYKIAYWAKNAKSGLGLIPAKVMRPDGVVVGPIILTESVEPGFEGCYTGFFNTVDTDPEGSYLFVINSSSESNYRAFKSETFEKKFDGEITVPSLDIGINRRQVIEAVTESQLQVMAQAESKSIAAVIEKKEESLEAYFYKDDLEFFLDNNELIGDAE